MNNIRMPASCAMLNENEKMDTIGGAVNENAIKTMAGVGGVIGLVGLAASAASTIFTGSPFGWIEGIMNTGRSFIDGSVEAGQKFLNTLMGVSLL